MMNPTSKMTKVDRLLAAAVEKLSKADPETLLNVVITPADQTEVESLVSYLEKKGGRFKRDPSGTLSWQAPAGEVKALAESGLASHLRLARLHQMHGTSY